MVLSVTQIRDSEQFTMQSEPIAPIDLMERAANALFGEIKNISESNHICNIYYNKYVVFCGAGNNGGDGLALARLLATDDCSKKNDVTVVKCFGTARLSQDCQTNLQRLENLLPQYPNLKIEDFSPNLVIEAGAVVVDSVFGIGLSRPLTGYFAEIVEFINKHKSTNPIFSVDVPSGLFADVPTPAANALVEADRTFTFQFQKLAYLLPENSTRVGRVSVLNIGLRLPENDSFRPFAKMIDLDLVRKIYRPAQKFDHKGSNGFGLLIAGSELMPGAAVLAAEAAMRSGIGKVVVHTAARAANALACRLPEALLDIDATDCFSDISLENLNVNVVAVGPGLGKSPKTVNAVKNLLDELRSPLIIDADALNILSENKVWLSYLPENTILTPHFKEFERLVGKSRDDFDRIEKLKEFSKRYGVIVVLKGANSAVAFPDGRLFFNTTGNPGMATAGAGDVLTGVLLACLAKGYPTEHAALLAVWLHGRAGDFAAEKSSQESLIASDISNNLGNAFAEITGAGCM